MPSPTTGGSTSSVPFTGDRLIDGLVVGEKWGGGVGTGTSVTYSFPATVGSTWSTSPSRGYDSPDSIWEPWDAEYRGLNATEQNAVRVAMQAWGAVANVGPVETADNANVVGDIRIAFTTGGTMDPDTYAYAYTPLSNTPYAGDVWLNPFPPEPAGNDFAIGHAGYATIIHELGHALGLDHPFDHANPSLDFPAALDTFKYTVMSYSDAPGHIDTAYSSFYPTTPMLLDIQALQYLYGANMTYHTGNDVYVFSQDENYYQTIWDAAGIDTIRYDATTDGGRIDLRAGKFSELGNTILLSDGVTQQDDTVAIAYDVMIENATGGAVGDQLIGNAAANVLDGRGGADTMQGGPGNDVYVVDSAADLITELTGRGKDLVQAASGYVLGAKVEKLNLTGGAAIDGTGNPLANTITGNAAANLLDGRGGADLLVGGKGKDIYVVNTAGDTVTEQPAGGADQVRTQVSLALLDDNVENLRLLGSANLNATGNVLANIIYANAGSNHLDGGTGADTLSYQYGANAGVTVNLALSTAQATGGSGSDTLSAFERLIGSDFGDTLTGRNGNNVLKGLAGSDTLSGKAGNDTLVGGTGADDFNFDTALDAVSNRDRITDFNVTADTMQVDLDVFDAFTVANVALSGPAFYRAPGATAHDASDRIIYDTSTGNLYYDPDGTGAADATLFVTLAGAPLVTASDFFIVP